MASLITAFTYKKTLTFDTSATGANVASAQTDFPICVHLNGSSWATQAERDAFFDNAGATGKRVQFFDSDETTNLPYEVEYFSNVQGSEEAVYWVKVPSVAGNSTTDKIVAAYGNDPNAADQDQPTSVWNSAYVIVQHMGDNSWAGGAPEALDSTSNNNDGTNTGTVDASGKVRRGRQYDGVDDVINYGNGASLQITGDMTLMALIYPTNIAGPNIGVAGKRTGTDNTAPYSIDIYGNQVRWIHGGGAGSGGVAYSAASSIADNTWYQIVGRTTGTTMETLVNGAISGSPVTFNGTRQNLSAALRTGFFIDSALWPFKGTIDEFRISNVARSNDWLKLEYYSMLKTNFNGDSWLTWGSQESTGGGGATGFMTTMRGYW